MKNRYKKLEISDIPNFEFEGYYWYSNSVKPILLKNEKFHTAVLSKMPFVIEGNLYCKAEEISIQIKNIDGVYHIAKIDISGLYDEAKIFIGHDLEKQNYKMIQVREEDTDLLCDKMTITQPAWNAFAGFTDENTKK